ncbi:DUF6056 family protein [Streptomyces sp. NPDC092952]|uniref:DUF6056 family protein n=1 Tax=Streptomyces sp. NPDC092952 TaxID=3366018 RepID=UPI00383019D6
MTTDTLETPRAPERERDRGRRDARRRATGWTAALGLFPFTLLAAVFWFGRLVRPGADDWCFLPVVRDEGASGMIAKFYYEDNGRVANALMVVAYGVFGASGHPWYALVSGVVMVGILWALTVTVLRRTGLTAPRGTPLVAASVVAVVFFLATPDTYKVFYWPANSVSHTLAPVLVCAAVIPLLRARTRRGRGVALGIALLGGFFFGTLSEETSVVACVLLGTVLLLGPLARPGPGRALVRRWCVLALAGIAAGVAVLYTSPGAHARRSRFGADAGSMLDAGRLATALRAFGEILGTVLTTWQYLGALAAGLLLGLLARDAGRTACAAAPDGGAAPGPLRSRPLLLAAAGALAFLVSGFLCTVITYPAFGATVVNAARVWGDFLLVYVLLLAALGALLGRAVRARWGARTAVAAVAAAVCALSCVGLAAPLFRLGTRMEVRAERWDRQDRALREGAAHGARVLPYTPVSVGRMVEPFGRHGQRPWPAECVAQYYGLDKVTYSQHGAHP